MGPHRLRPPPALAAAAAGRVPGSEVEACRPVRGRERRLERLAAAAERGGGQRLRVWHADRAGEAARPRNERAAARRSEVSGGERVLRCGRMRAGRNMEYTSGR